MSAPGKYGEPWRASGDGMAEQLHRAIACVNACAGLDIPADAPLGWLAQRERQREALARLAAYAEHKQTCRSHDVFDACDCGFRETLNAASFAAPTTTNPDTTP